MNPTPSGFFHEEVWWTVERIRLHGWLLEKAGHLAPTYLGALQMVMNESFPGRVHFVAHAIREIRNRLPNAIAGVENRGPTYEALASKLRTAWKEAGFPSDGSVPLSARAEPSVSGPGHEVSVGLIGAAGELVAANARSSGNRERQARRLLREIWETDPPPYVVDRWFHRNDWIRRYMHLDDKPHVQEAEVEVTEVFESFETALIAIANRSYENLEALDEILASANR